jgi:hypothetical protein
LKIGEISGVSGGVANPKRFAVDLVYDGYGAGQERQIFDWQPPSKLEL